MKKILITGGSGFIGFHLAKKLSKKNKIIIVDNLNDYYDTNLKKKRNQQQHSSVTFYKLDLCNKNDILKLFKKYDFDIVVHLAAQAEVRYSLINPYSYIQNNIVASYNLLDVLKDFDIKHFLFSSTSSVYGNRQTKDGFKETDKVSHQLSLYSSTKRSVESLIHNYSYNYKLPSTVLRFFTVYGPWGRPDMALFKFTSSILQEKTIDVFNNGNLWRDFTFIDDLVESIARLLKVVPTEYKINDELDSLSPDAPFRIINIGNQKSVKLNDMIDILEKTIGKNAFRLNLPMQPGDVEFTLSNSKLLKKLTNFSPNTHIEEGVFKFYDWYKKFYHSHN